MYFTWFRVESAYNFFRGDRIGLWAVFEEDAQARTRDKPCTTWVLLDCVPKLFLCDFGTAGNFGPVDPCFHLRQGHVVPQLMIRPV